MGAQEGEEDKRERMGGWGGGWPAYGLAVQRVRTNVDVWYGGKAQSPPLSPPLDG